MKLKCEVLEVSNDGDALCVTLQGSSKSDPDWYGWKNQTIRLRSTERTRRAFYIGRIVEIEVTPVRDRTP